MIIFYFLFETTEYSKAKRNFKHTKIIEREKVPIEDKECALAGFNFSTCCFGSKMLPASSFVEPNQDCSQIDALMWAKPQNDRHPILLSFSDNQTLKPASS